MYLSAGLVVLAGAGGCSPPVGPPDERGEFRVLRPDDLLSLHFELRNLRIETDGRGPPRLVRIDDAADAYLVVQFPGQHIAEEAFGAAGTSGQFAPIARPVRSRIAQPTQLVFRMPSGVDFVELTLQSLLEWNLLEQTTPEIDADEKSLTRIADWSRVELPVGLALAPDSMAHWTHAIKPVVHNGRTELWHTRLASANSGGSSTVSILGSGYAPEIDFETALSDDDRSLLVGKSALARTLILSPMGGWLDVRGRWEPETAADISRWEHAATAGQDQRVVVERQEGFLYPFGHRATVLSVTERGVEEVPAPGATGTVHVAMLRKRDFVVIKEPQVTYRPGEMALQALTARSLVTPALIIADKSAGAFWIETLAGMPYPFRFAAKDWADGELDVAAPAVFVRADADKTTIDAVYDHEDYSAHRTTGMQGQSAAVAKFQPGADAAADGPDDPAGRPRSAGDTTLQLLALAFTSVATDADAEGRRFRCTTESMLIRIPSLEPFLDEAQNRGWFELVDPDEENNRGEVFARALPSEAERIPMYFDQQADRSGGIAAPSFDVDGLSRIHGPVGNAELVRSGEGLSGESYFNAERATLLGGLPLARLLDTGDGSRSPAIPRIDFIIGRKQPEDDPETGDQPDPEKPAYWEVGLGLTWSVALGPFGAGSFVSFEPDRDDEDKSISKLEIAVNATRRLGKDDEPGEENGDAPSEAPSRVVNLTAEGKITNFALVLHVSETDKFSIGFEHISVKLGPPNQAENEPATETPNEADDDTADDDKKKERSISPEVEFRLSAIDATGGLNFVKRVIEAAAMLPPLPDLPEGEAPTAYPAKLPGVGNADISVNLGPFEAPKFKLMQFDVSNVNATLGIGLNILPRSTDPSTPPEVPPTTFAINIASADKPLILLAAPWGGIAHLGLNFTPERVTGFQFSLGVVNKAEFDLGAGKAKCEGSLAAAFTYWLEDDDHHYELDVILKLNGQAKLWFIDIHLTLVAVGAWSDHLWSFSAELVVRVQIAFFAVQARFTFYHEIADESGGGDRLLTSAGAYEDAELTKAEWLAYRAAFAKAA